MFTSEQQINHLKALLKQLGIECTDADLQSTALAITRFVYAKEVVRRHQELPIKEIEYERNNNE